MISIGGLLRWVVGLDSKDTIGECFIRRCALTAALLLKNDRVGLLLLHLLHFFLMLVFLGLLADFKEVGVENLVWVQGVRVRIVLFVVRLVHALQLIVALRDSCDRRILAQREVLVEGLGVVAGLKLGALVLKDQDDAVCDLEELTSVVFDRLALFVPQIELDYV